MTTPILEVQDIRKHYELKKGVFQKPDILKAADGVSLRVYPGETLGIVGESGCGKSTVGRLILRIEEASGGRILFQGRDIAQANEAELRQYRRRVQIVFQDPYSSLNPRWKVGQIIGEPLELNLRSERMSRKDIRERVLHLMEKVGLLPDLYHRYPHQFSGGQRQRICIARALALQPEVIVCDEPVSALDVSIQSQVLNLLLELQQEFNLTYIFISHDLSVVEHISDRIAVMYLGRVVESATTDRIFSNPRHPYTRALLSSVPELDVARRKKRELLTGDLPSPVNPPSGCTFRTRCPQVRPECSSVSMELAEVEESHGCACPYP